MCFMFGASEEQKHRALGLTDEEADMTRARIVDALRERFGAELRS